MIVSPETVFNYYKKNLSPKRYPNLRAAAEYFGVSHSTIREYLLKLESLGRVQLRSRKLFLVENGKVIDQRGRHNESANEKKSRGGRSAAAILRKRAEDKGLEYNALGFVPASDERKIAERIERIVEKAIGDGTCYKPTYIRAGGSKVG